MTIEAVMEEVKKMVTGKPGFVSVGIGKDVTDREAIVITIENSSGSHYLDLPISVEGYKVKVVRSSPPKGHFLKRTTHIDLRRYI